MRGVVAEVISPNRYGSETERPPISARTSQMRRCQSLARFRYREHPTNQARGGLGARFGNRAIAPLRSEVTELLHSGDHAGFCSQRWEHIQGGGGTSGPAAGSRTPAHPIKPKSTNPHGNTVRCIWNGFKIEWTRSPKIKCIALRKSN